MTFDFPQAMHKLSSIEQQHLLQHFGQLLQTQKDALLSRLERLDIQTFLEQRRTLSSHLQQVRTSLEPFTDFSLSGNLQDAATGKQLIAQGALGCLIVAGGQGTRLNFTGPKGMFPISIIKHKSLFQFFAEKTAAAGRQAHRELPLAIMTSPANQIETESYFKQHAFFGLKPEQLSFFPQSTLPLLNQKGDLFLETPDTLAEGPDGNGSALHLFYQSGIWEQWYFQGVRYLNFIVIDNPLADPFDAELLGFHDRTESTVTVKCVARRHANEKVGVLAKQGNQTIVVEYSELADIPKSATLPNGTLRFACANVSLFCFDMEFVRQMAERPVAMPLHPAFKASKFFTKEEDFAWKFEKFIFDTLPYAANVNALLYPREICFSPLKNSSGEHSIASVQRDLQLSDQKTFSEISGLPCHISPFEIAQDFYYPTPELIAKWKGRAPHAGYLQP